MVRAIDGRDATYTKMPLRRVISTEQQGDSVYHIDTLDCGHQICERKPARRRRCWQCWKQLEVASK